MNDNDEIKNLVGKSYFGNKHRLKYGGAVDLNGIIQEALTKDEADVMKNMCPVDKANILFAGDLLEWIEYDPKTGYKLEVRIIDEVLEFLRDQDVLTPKGKELAHAFWERYVHGESGKTQSQVK